MFAQHALAPGIDGEDGGFVHGLGGHHQAMGGLLPDLARRMGVDQGAQKVVLFIRCVATKTGGGLDQSFSDAVGQLARGRPRKRHDQDFVRH